MQAAHIGETLSLVRTTVMGQSRGKAPNMEAFSPYLAGFFDGDGSLHFQIVRQKEYRFGFYVRVSLVFYQATSCEAGLKVIRHRLNAGRLRRRSGMSDLTITHRPTIRTVLERMEPYVIFKKRQVEEGLTLLDRLPPPRTRSGFLQVCEAIDAFASLNFSKSRKVTSATVREAWESKGFGVPVTTDPLGETEVDSSFTELNLSLP